MTDTEKLQAIRAHCVEFLELASKRTAGKWLVHSHQLAGTRSVGGDDYYSAPSVCYINPLANAAFIAACAGPAEAMARSTIAAIDAFNRLGYCPHGCDTVLDDMADEILSAWPDEVLAK